MDNKTERSKAVITICLSRDLVDEIMQHVPPDAYYIASLIADERLTNARTWQAIGATHGFAMQRAYENELPNR